MLKTLSNFSKTWRLLKILSSKQPQDVEKILDSATREAFLLSEKIDLKSKETNTLISKKIENLESQIKTTLQNSERDVSIINNNCKKDFDNLAEHIEKKNDDLAKSMYAYSKANNTLSENINSNLTEISSVLTAIRDYSSRQSAEVLRWKDGYDYRILKNFLTRIIHCIDEIENKINLVSEKNLDSPIIAELEFIKEILISNLDGEGLVRIEPTVGAKLDQNNPKIVVKDITDTDNQAKDSTIAKIINYGYEIYLSNDDVKTIRPAYVDIFRKK